MDDLIRRSDAIREIRMAFKMGEHYCDRASIVGRIRCIPAVKSCSDAISREYALGVIYPSNIYSSRADIYKALKDAPSVTVEPKQGEWKINNNGWAYCSECESLGLESYSFCPYCGAKMKGADDE